MIFPEAFQIKKHPVIWTDMVRRRMLLFMFYLKRKQHPVIMNESFLLPSRLPVGFGN